MLKKGQKIPKNQQKFVGNPYMMIGKLTSLFSCDVN
jgi:hypothetical protein